MEISDREYRELGKIRAAFNCNPEELPLKPDLKFIKSVQKLVSRKPNLKHKTVLFISRPQFKYHEKSILLFLNRKFGRCDCCRYAFRHASLNIKLENVKYIGRSSLFRSSYDYVVVYKGLAFLSDNIAKIRSRNFFIFFTVTEAAEIEKDPSLLRRLRKSGKKITYLNLFKNTLHYIHKPRPEVKMKASINWPPSIDVFFQAPRSHVFDFMFMGGGARDYRFLYENRGLFQDKKVIVTHCDAKKFYTQKRDRLYDERYIPLLEKTGNFICLNRISEPLYTRLLLYSRIILCLFRRIISTDSTCISDAVWYGKPVITNNIQATAHLKDIVFYINDANDLRHILKKLDHPGVYRTTSKRILESARKDHNIFDLLKLICSVPGA